MSDFAVGRAPRRQLNCISTPPITSDENSLIPRCGLCFCRLSSCSAPCMHFWDRYKNCSSSVELLSTLSCRLAVALQQTIRRRYYLRAPDVGRLNIDRLGMGESIISAWFSNHSQSTLEEIAILGQRSSDNWCFVKLHILGCIPYPSTLSCLSPCNPLLLELVNVLLDLIRAKGVVAVE
jgi:hypothetical protein